MNAASFLDEFDVLVDAPGGIDRIRRLIVQLAVQGRLVAQDPDESPANRALDVVRKERGDHLSVRVRGRPVVPRIPEKWECKSPPPRGWEWARLDDTGEYVNGLAFKSSDWTSSGLPIIRIQNLTDPTKEFNYAQGDYPPDRQVTAGDLLVSWSATLDVFRWEGGDALVNQHIFKVIPDERLVYRPFLFFLLRDTIRDMADSEKAHGLVMKHINRGPFLSHPVLIPPLAEQHRIVARVDELMALLDRLEAAKEARDATRAQLRDAALAALQDANDAEELKTAWSRIADHMHDLFADPADILPLRSTILELAVHGHLVPQDSVDDSANALLEQVATEKTQLVQDGKIRKPKALPPLTSDETPFALPEGWEWCRLGQVLLEIEAGWSPSALKRPKEGGEWGVLKVSSCSWGTFRPDENKALPPGTHPRVHLEVRDGDFLISRANTIELVARSVVVVEPPERLMLSDKTLRLTPSSNACVGYLNLVNLCKSSRQHYGKHATGTSASMRNVSQGAIRELPIPLPPAAEQSRILEKVEELTTLLDRLEETLRASRESQEAFSASAVRAMPEDRLGVEEGSAVAVG